jgi:hypothetical protein
MNRTVWKFPLERLSQQEVAMPRGAQILCARLQFETLCLWALVDPSAPAETRRIVICGTGHPAPAPNEGVYFGTFQTCDGAFIFHVFELTSTQEPA